MAVPFGGVRQMAPPTLSPSASGHAGFASGSHSGTANFQDKLKVVFLARVVPPLPRHTHSGFSHENVGLLDLSSSGAWRSAQPARAAKHEQTQFNAGEEIHRSTSNRPTVSAHHAEWANQLAPTVRFVFQRHGAFLRVTRC